MKRNDWILFLIGLGSETQIRLVGYIGISELILFVIGPFIFMRNYYRLKHDGFMPLIWLTWLAFLGGWASGMLNDVPMRSILKGVAAPYSVFCAICTIHHFLSRDLKSVRYFFIGIAFSFVISRFIFQPGNISVSRGVKLKQEEAAVAALTSSLFLIQLLGYGLTIPVYGWFKKVPKLYCVVALLVIGYVGFAMSNNRSSLIMVFASLFLIVVGGKTAHAQKFLRKSFWLVMIGSLLIAPLVNRFYIYSASHGYLGKEAEGKYRAQSKRGTDILSILMSGRTAFFAGLVAAFDKPLIGHGPWAVDYKGYWHKFLFCVHYFQIIQHELGFFNNFIKYRRRRKARGLNCSVDFAPQRFKRFKQKFGLKQRFSARKSNSSARFAQNVGVTQYFFGKSLTFYVIATHPYQIARTRGNAFFRENAFSDCLLPGFKAFSAPEAAVGRAHHLDFIVLTFGAVTPITTKRTAF